jgi:hypothetical protein
MRQSVSLLQSAACVALDIDPIAKAPSSKAPIVFLSFCPDMFCSLSMARNHAGSPVTQASFP